MKPWGHPNLFEGEQLHGKLLLPDTVTGKMYEPIKNSKMKIYVCGITPYDSAHVGHLFTYLIFDVVIRAARKLGADVIYVQNITDIDDPLFERARLMKRSWQEIAEEQIINFKSAMEFLRIIPPDHFASVTDEIKAIVNAAGFLKNESYELDSSVYFKTNAEKLLEFTKTSYEELLKQSEARGGDPGNLNKVNPLDPKIWLTSASDEPSWESVYGLGRPGWHIECVAIANKYLGETFDLQGGGKDLLFPHHAFCNELNLTINQKPLARGFLHVELVEYEGDKMSKSLGNLIFLQNLLDAGFTANEIRIGLLLKRWDQSWGFNMEVIQAGRNIYNFWLSSLINGSFPKYEDLVESAMKTIFSGLNISDFISGIGNLDFPIQEEKDLLKSADFLSDLIGVEFGNHDNNWNLL